MNGFVEAAFVLIVSGVAMVWPPGALIVGGIFLAVLAYIADRRTPPVVVGTPEGEA